MRQSFMYPHDRSNVDGDLDPETSGKVKSITWILDYLLQVGIGIVSKRSLLFTRRNKEKPRTFCVMSVLTSVLEFVMLRKQDIRVRFSSTPSNQAQRPLHLDQCIISHCSILWSPFTPSFSRTPARSKIWPTSTCSSPPLPLRELLSGICMKTSIKLGNRIGDTPCELSSWTAR